MNIEFLEAGYLYLLVLLPLFIIFLTWSNIRRKFDFEKITAGHITASVITDVSYYKRWAKIPLLILSMTTIIIALAQPAWGKETAPSKYINTEVIFLLDISESMLALDLQPNRLEHAKQLIREMMVQLKGCDIGLGLFSGASYLLLPLTRDIDTALTFIDIIEPSYISHQGTNLEKALKLAVASFSDDIYADRIIILLSDGETFEGDVSTAAKAAHRADIQIYTIGVATLEGSPIPQSQKNGELPTYRTDSNGALFYTKLVPETLMEISQKTNGQYYFGGENNSDITRMVGEIYALNLGAGGDSLILKPILRHEWFVVLAVLALAVERLLGERRLSG